MSAPQDHSRYWKPREVPVETVLCTHQGQAVTGKLNTWAVKDFRAADGERMKAEFGRGLAYATDLLGCNPFAKAGWDIDIKQKGDFGGNGTYWQFPYAQLVAMETDPQAASMARAAIVHEFMHLFREEEDVAMFAEMIYLLEHGQSKRLHDIQRYHDRPEEYGFFKESYVWGYRQIANVLNVNPARLAEALQDLPIDRIREMFRGYAQGLLRQEGLLAEERAA